MCRLKWFASAALLAVVAFSVQAQGAGGDKVLPPNASAYGRSLSEWLGDYWRWFYTSSDTSQPHAAGPVVFMPLPAAEWMGGDWSPEDPAYVKGQIEVTLQPGTPFVLPAVCLGGERYLDWPARADDPLLPKETFMGFLSDEVMTLDGVPILRDFSDYYVSGFYDPMVAYPAPTSYGAVGLVYYQTVGFVAAPLAPGRHVIHLYERFVLPGGLIPGSSWGVIYDNTWIINVVPGKGPK
jgi:hypothetical protein